MFTLREGEILLKEKYGSSPTDRFYVKPPGRYKSQHESKEQRNVVILDEKKYYNNVVSGFTKIFLPQGYPDSVSADYIQYQKWDTAQAFCSTITGILATQEVLRGVGVGDTHATPLAATITWVLKDGCGHIGRILFAYSHGTYLDAYSKKWRLYADTLNDAAMCIEISLPMFKNFTTFALCVSTVMKAIVGVAGGATRVAMTQHHAVRGNMADVSAKDAAQETAVNLIASLAALLIMALFGNSVFIFIMMIILHITFNYFAVRAVCLKTLNEPRFLQVIDLYIKKEVIASPCEINQNEPIIFYQLGPNLLDLKLAGFQIKLGGSIKKLIKERPNCAYLRGIKEVYLDRNYMVVPEVSRRQMAVLVKEDATADDVLCAYFHAVLLSIVTCAINDETLSAYQDTREPRPFAQVCRTLQAAEWSREPLEAPRPGTQLSYEPSVDLMKYVDNIVNNEWIRARAGMVHTGWDLSKHLLMVDEWRVCNEKFEAKSISMEKIPHSESIVLKTRPSDAKPFEDVLSNISEQDGFTIEPEHNLEMSRELSRARIELLRNRSDQRVLTATEVKPDIVPLKKE